MELTLPKNKSKNTELKINTNSLIIIGANGSGKTRFSTAIEKKYSKIVHRISAQKSLSMPKEVSPKSKKRAELEFWYGNYNENLSWLEEHGKMNYRWGNNPDTFLLNDYEKLMVLLHTEEYEESLKYKEGKISIKPITKLDKIQSIFESLISHKILEKKAGVIEVYSKNNSTHQYNASEMSDGERIVFYLIGEVICAKENSIIIVDEPENHLHKSIVKKLWDKIENERPDCTFIYLTHDMDFAISRTNSQVIWMKSYEGNNIWDYEVLNEIDLPESLYLEILGSRKPILFIEGDDSSIDYKLYQKVFDEYNIKAVGSCDKVFNITKAFNEQKNLHHIDAFGLIDRDRRTNEEITNINHNNIWIVSVAEVENLFLLEEVVKQVAKKMMKNPNEVFEKVKLNVIKFFDTQKEKQALEHTISRLERLLNNATNYSVKTIDELKTNFSTFWENLDIQNIYQEILLEFQKLIDEKNYDEILKVFNNKGIIANSKIQSLCDLNTKNDAYLNYVIAILKQNNSISKRIRQAIIEKINKQ